VNDKLRLKFNNCQTKKWDARLGERGGTAESGSLGEWEVLARKCWAREHGKGNGQGLGLNHK